MRNPNAGNYEPWLEKREKIAGYTPPEEISEPDLDQLERVAGYLNVIEEVEEYLIDYYSRCQRQGVAEELERRGHEEDTEFVVLREQSDGEGFSIEDRFVLGERQDTLEQAMPEYRNAIIGQISELYDMEELDEDSGAFYEPLDEIADTLDHGVENEHDLEELMQELDRDDRFTIRHYVENRKGHGQKHSDTFDEFVTRNDEYALNQLLGDISTITVEGVDGLEQIGEEFRSWGRHIAAEMDKRRHMRRNGDETVTPWQYELTTQPAGDVSYIQ